MPLPPPPPMPKKNTLHQVFAATTKPTIKTKNLQWKKVADNKVHNSQPVYHIN